MSAPVTSNVAGAAVELVEEVVEGEITAGIAPAPNTSVIAIAAGAVVPAFWKTTFLRIWKGPSYPTWNYAFEIALNVSRAVLYHQKAAQKVYYSNIPPEDRRRTVLLRYKDTRERIDGGLKRHRYNNEGINFEQVGIFRRDYPDCWRTGTELDAEIKHEGVLEAEWVSHKSSTEDRVCIYFHGGAYAAMSSKTHRGMTTHIARTSKCGVLSVDYRLAPENPFPAAIHDAILAYLYVTRTIGVSPDRVILAGDSAGGGLASSLVHYIRDYGKSIGIPQPAGVALISAWLDLSSTSGPSWTDKIIPDYIPYFETVPTQDWWDPSVLYMGKHSLKHPLASTIWGKWNDLPPIIAHYGGLERLYSDGQLLVEKLEEESENKNWTVEFFPGGIHVSHGFMNIMEEGRLGMEHLCKFMEEIWENSGRSEMIGKGMRTVRNK